MDQSTPYTTKMTPEEWYGVQDNPRQRDTEKHAARAHHLMTPKPSHSVVHMASLPDETRYKIDGHTRAHLWSKGTVPAPEELTVVVYRVPTIEDVKDLYIQFDNPSAVETSSDNVFGAFREAGYVPQSTLLRGGKLLSALRMVDYFTGTPFNSLTKRADATVPYWIIKRYLPQLKALDRMHPKVSNWPASVIAAFVTSHLRHGDSIIPFWERYENNEGEKTKGHMDAIQALTEEITRRRASRRGELGGFHNMMVVIGRALSCVEGWLAGAQYSSLPTGLDPASYLMTQAGRLRILPEFRPDDDPDRYAIRAEEAYGGETGVKPKLRYGATRTREEVKQKVLAAIRDHGAGLTMRDLKPRGANSLDLSLEYDVVRELEREGLIRSEVKARGNRKAVKILFPIGTFVRTERLQPIRKKRHAYGTRPDTLTEYELLKRIGDNPGKILAEIAPETVKNKHNYRRVQELIQKGLVKKKPAEGRHGNALSLSKMGERARAEAV